MDQLKQICQSYRSYNHVFKKCFDQYKNQYIVVLEKTNQTRDNEMRSDVFNRDFASFRASVLKVLLIIDFKNLNYNLDQITSYYEKPITRVGDCKIIQPIYTDYIKSELVHPDCYDEYIFNVCSNGIHYFKSLDAAYYYDLDQMEYVNGYCIRFNASGAKEGEGLYVNNKMHGQWTFYALKEDPALLVTYENGIEIEQKRI